MRHGTCVTHVPWCIPGSLNSGFLWRRWRGKRYRYSRLMRNPQSDVSGKRPMDKEQPILPLFVGNTSLTTWNYDVTKRYIFRDVRKSYRPYTVCCANRKKLQNSVIHKMKTCSKIHHSHILQSERQNCEIIGDMALLIYVNHTKPLLNNHCHCIKMSINNTYVLYNRPNLCFEIWLISPQIIYVWYIELTCQNIFHVRIFAFTFWVDLVAPIPLWRHKGVAMNVIHKIMHWFWVCTLHWLPPPVSEFRLQMSAF